MIYTLFSTDSFCDFLAKKWIAEKKDVVWGLSHITVIMPTNRSVKTLKDAFLRQSEGKTLLLPKIISLSDLDFLSVDVYPSILPLVRQLLLSKLIQKKQNYITEDKAFIQSGVLADLIDQMHHYDIDFQKIKDLAPENFAIHWQQTLSFLEIIKDFWPQILQDRKETDVAQKQIVSIRNLISFWKKNPPETPIIALGFTGGLPIIEEFLNAVNSLPKGDVFIPNLDTSLSDEVWNNLDVTHPQFYIKKLLDKLGISRKQVLQLNEKTARFDLLSNALKPAKMTSEWLDDAKKIDVSAIHNLRRIECKTPQTEAFEIACILRESLESPNKKAILVTTDRTLARRVKIQMQRWGINIDDSAGTSLSKTNIGTFLMLIAEVALNRTSVNFLALLKHPFTLDGEDILNFRKKIHLSEKEARENRTAFIPQLQANLEPLMDLFVNPKKVPFEVILKAHLEVAHSLAVSLDKSAEERLWKSDAGEAAHNLLEDLLNNADIIGDIDPLLYPSFLNALLSSVNVRPKYGMHPRLDILGPIEARLQQADLVVIGGMNEGTFPQIPEIDFWINRPMRLAVNLPIPEEKIGVSAQDFMHLMQAPQVILTRSLKSDGTPTIPSRWWERLEAFLDVSHIDWKIENETFSKFLEKDQDFQEVKRPSPCPPTQVRPNKLSISEICTLLSDPYIIYAKKILKLYKLPELDENISMADFGNVVHNALHIYLKENTNAASMSNLIEIGKKCFNEGNIIIEENPFLWEKFKRIADWFIQQETDLKPEKQLLETSGTMEVRLGSEKFYLTGRADRIDVYPNKNATIIDYKTGYAPTKAQVLAGFAPQLILEAIMLENGNFEDVKKDEVNVTELQYWKLIGKSKAGEISQVMSPSSLQENDTKKYVFSKLIQLLTSYQDAQIPYMANLQASHEQKYNDYRLLERSPEWQTLEDE